MKIEIATCPHCGKQIKASTFLNNYYCKYCNFFIDESALEIISAQKTEMKAKDRRIAELDEKCEIMYRRGAELLLPPEDERCSTCGGTGKKSYGSTSMWRGGIGGQMITVGPCNECWGSGEKNRKFADMRRIESKLKELEEQLDEARRDAIKMAELAMCGAEQLCIERGGEPHEYGAYNDAKKILKKYGDKIEEG